jgi:hypothetical protein
MSSASASPTAAATTSSSTAPTAVPQTPRTQQVTFGSVNSPIQWGDESLASATASSGLPITYTSTGGCTVDPGTGRVQATQVGTCVVTAAQAGSTAWQPARASVQISVLQAHPSISFPDKGFDFRRGFRESLLASTTPAIPLTYRTRQGYQGPCSLQGDQLLFADWWQGRPAQLAARCEVEASAAVSSPNYSTPTPVLATIGIGFPQLAVSIQPVGGQISYAQVGGHLTVTVKEGSGDAYGVAVDTTGPTSSRLCSNPGAAATPAYPTTAGPHVYTATITLTQPPAGGSYVCEVRADALPLDHASGKSTDVIRFTVLP